MIRKEKKIENKDIKKALYLALISTIIIIITNIISYNYLPEYVSIKSNGSSTIQKELYVIIFPCVSIITNFINLKLNNRGILNSILLNIILPVINAYIIFTSALI